MGVIPKIIFRSKTNYVYFLFCAVLSVLLFIHGFFPIQIYDSTRSSFQDLPKSIDNITLEPQKLYQRKASKIVLMVIDALRTDFVYEESSTPQMPYLYSLLRQPELSYAFIAEAESPTVTMPRIKAMTTGAVPNYIDVVLNFGNTQISGDSIVHQMDASKLRTVFYGDDTWIRVFPIPYYRSEGTTSFYVNDFYEVDSNVTRNVVQEIVSPDWDVMILHYLGLDHIGHVEGPKGRSIKNKLLEMDNVINKIHKAMSHWDMNSTLPSMLIVCGDHGMRDSGGHGGSSAAEILVPLVFLTKHSTQSKQDRLSHVRQIDLAPTLATMLGLPIPSNSVGTVIDSVLPTSTSESHLYTLLYNAEHLAKKFRNEYPDFERRECYKQFNEAKAMHKNWLLLIDKDTNKRDIGLAKIASNLYKSAANEISNELTQSKTKFDVYSLFAAIILVWQALIMALLSLYTDDVYINDLWGQFKLASVMVNLILCKFCPPESVLYQYSSFGVSVLVGSIIMINIQGIISMYHKLNKIQIKFDAGTVLIMIGTAFHMFSLCSSSFIEEEHVTFFFLTNLFIIFLIYKKIQLLFYKFTINVYDRNEFSDDLKYVGKLLLVSVMLRMLRRLNNTGDMYRDWPDVADWLNMEENKSILHALYIFALCCIFAVNYDSKDKLFSITVYIMLFLIYTDKVESGFLVHNIDQYQYLVKYRLAKLAHLMTLICINLRTIYHWYKTSNNRVTVLSYCTIVTALLHRPCNVILVPAAVFATKTVVEAMSQDMKHAQDYVLRTVGLTWLSYSFYFFQGNSNSLATIDVMAAYAGFSVHSSIVCGAQILLNTYTGPLIVAITTLRYSKRLRHCSIIPRTLTVTRLLPLALYMTLMGVQRHHLFVWTVFSPKMMYEAVHTVLLFIIMALQSIRIRI